MNKETLGIILGTGLMGLAKSKLSGSAFGKSKFKDIYNGYSLEVYFTVNTRPILDETIFKDEVDWYFWFITQPGFFNDGISFFNSIKFSESVRKKYSDKIRSEDKWLSRWETLQSGINTHIDAKEITTVHTGRFTKRKKETINSLIWQGKIALTIRLPFSDGKTTSKDIAELLKNELLTISEIVVDEMNQKVIEFEKEHNVKSGVRFALDSISTHPISTGREEYHYFYNQNKPFQNCFLNPRKFEIVFKEDVVHFVAKGIVIQGTSYTADQIDGETLEFAPQKSPILKKFGDIRLLLNKKRKSKLRRR